MLPRDRDRQRVQRLMLASAARPVEERGTAVSFEMFGSSRVSLVLLLPFAAVLVPDGDEISVGLGAFYEVDRAVIESELC